MRAVSSIVLGLSGGLIIFLAAMLSVHRPWQPRWEYSTRIGYDFLNLRAQSKQFDRIAGSLESSYTCSPIVMYEGVDRCPNPGHDEGCYYSGYIMIRMERSTEEEQETVAHEVLHAYNDCFHHDISPEEDEQKAQEFAAVVMKEAYGVSQDAR
jgi:hypothetical protein